MIRELAGDHGDIADAYVTLCVHAGIAAADVICCASLGEHAQGENHDEAIGLLVKADRGVAKHLRTLLNVKTKSGYSPHIGDGGRVQTGRQGGRRPR